MHEESIEIVISDNDPSQCFTVPDVYADTIRLFRTGGSSSFAHGNNIAAKEFLNDTHDSLLVLNNDTIAVRGSVARLRETLMDSSIGAVGPCMPYASNPQRVWACGGYIDKFSLRIGGVTEGFDYDIFDVDYLPGAAILCRADIWRELGGLPESYFLAYEETQFSLEVRRLGFRVVADPKAVILHKVGMSGQSKPEYYYNTVRNRIVFAKYLYGKKFGFLYGMLVTSTGVGSRSFAVARRRIRLWFQAVYDELRNVNLDRNRLIEIAKKY
jgi:GT2 family glycosyltransferase